jgi:hypothetical protein
MFPLSSSFVGLALSLGLLHPPLSAPLAASLLACRATPSDLDLGALPRYDQYAGLVLKPGI